jgi:hypothetical protein
MPSHISGTCRARLPECLPRPRCLPSDTVGRRSAERPYGDPRFQRGPLRHRRSLRSIGVRGAALLRQLLTEIAYRDLDALDELRNRGRCCCTVWSSIQALMARSRCSAYAAAAGPIVTDNSAPTFTMSAAPRAFQSARRRAAQRETWSSDGCAAARSVRIRSQDDGSQLCQP